MQKRRIVAVVVGVMLAGLGAFAAAQNQPGTTQADKVITEPSRTAFAGNVVLTVNGVVVRADRAVIQDGEVALEGNVRLTLPKSSNVYTPAVMRYRIERQF